MSAKLKIPEKGLFGLPSSTRQTSDEIKDDSSNNQNKVITAKLLDEQETSNLEGKESNLLESQDELLHNSQYTDRSNVEESSSLEFQDTNHQISQESSVLNGKSSRQNSGQSTKSQNAQKQVAQTPGHLDAEPSAVQTSNQLNVEPLSVEPPSQQVNKVTEPQNAEPTRQQVDAAAEPLSVEETKQMDVEEPKKKKSKSSSLVKKTYYIDPDLDGAIELMAVLQKGDQSDIVRQLLRDAIPEYYLTQWKLMSSHSR